MLIRQTMVFCNIVAVLMLSACATRSVNPPLTHMPENKVYSYERKGQNAAQVKTLVALTFSGGGTRAAAFS